MKNTILKSVFALFLAFMALPMMSQNYLKIYFKDGHTERHFMHLVNNISMSKYDLEGNLHSDYQLQQIVMPDTTYSYYLADIDSMTFRKVDEEQIKKDIVNVISTIEPIFIQCSDSLTISQYLDQIQNLEGVEKVSLTEKDLLLYIKDSYPIIYHFSHNDASLKNYDTFSSHSPHKKTGLRYKNKKAFVLNQTYKIAFLNQQSNDLNRTSVYTNVNDIIQEYADIPNLNIEYIPSEKLTDDFFRNEIFSYDIIYLNTHGGYDINTKKHWILTGEEISVNNDPDWWDRTVAWWKDIRADLDEYRLSFCEEERLDKEGVSSIVPVWYIDISEDRINNSNIVFDNDYNTIFFDAACSNLEGKDELIRDINGEQKRLKGNDSMARMFVDNKNVDVFLGYNDWSNYLKNFNAFRFFLEYLFNGLSEEAAMYKLLLEHNLDVFNDRENNLVDQHNMLVTKITGHYKMDKDASDLLYHFEECVYFQLGETELYEAYKLITEMLEDLKTQGVQLITSEHIQNIINEIHFSVEINFGSESDHSNHIPNILEREWDCSLIDVADNKNIFLTSTNTKNLIQEEVDKEFKANGKVTISGFTSVLNLEESPIKCGFRFGDDPNLKNYVEIFLDPENYKEVSNELGNVEFSFELEPSPGQQMYYQAFTYDGIHYNLADEIYSFKAPEIPHLSLSSSTIAIVSGTSDTVDITAGSGSYSILDNTAPDVVTASISENSIVIKALTAGFAIITVKDDKSGETATIEVTVTENSGPVSYLTCPDGHHPHLIDLGLPSGTKWACCNVGTDKPEEYGGYYAWGEVEEKDYYDWSTYIHCDGDESTCHDLGSDIAGTEYDVAHVKWGDSWVMPSLDQIRELLDNCTYTWTALNDVNGGQFSGPNGGAIFLPAAGARYREVLKFGDEGIYWSSSPTQYHPSILGYADILSFSSSKADWNPFFCSWGFTVRPVYVDDVDNKSHLQLSTTTLALATGHQGTVEVTSGSGSYDAESNAKDVATVTVEGSKVIITAVNPGTAIITVKDDKSGETATIEVTVTENSGPVSYLACPDDHHPHLIDLGLPSGTKWACCNVDDDHAKQNPTNHGSYYAWGEVEEKDYYDWSTYIHCDGDESTCHDLGSDIAGTEYDVARVKWGDSWVMPSLDQIKELLDNCPSQWTTVGGINGRSFTGANGGTIFLPAAGFHYKEGNRFNIEGAYWSSSSMENFYASVSGYADILSFSSSKADQGPIYVYFGLTVRPVYVDDVVNKSHLELSTTTLTLTTGHQGTVMITSGSGSFDAVSNANNVATVTVDGAKLIIKAMAPGSATITVKDNQTQERAKIDVTVNEIPLSYLICPDDHHPHLIDLGLPSGTKWACCNVDSDPTKQTPSNYGGYYAWGETEEKDYYDWSTYIHCDNSRDSCHDLGSDIAGTGYDVAHYQWGDSWVMPSLDQIKELLDNCTYTWSALNGVNGGLFTGSNGGSIFLPAASSRWKDLPAETGWYGYYWSSTQLPSYSGYANDLYFDSVYPDDASWGRSDRYHGESVRPVWVP